MLTVDVTCGKGHGLDCLCDVRLKGAPTPINFTFSELWEAERMDTIPDEGEAMGFMESLLERYDRWRSSTVDGLVPTEDVRQEVLSHLRTHGYMEGAPYSVHRCARALTNGQPSPCWEWDEETWEAAEDFMYMEFEFHGRPWLAVNMSEVVGNEVTENLIRSLSDWYGVEINGDQARRMRMMRSLIDQRRDDVDKGLGDAAVVTQMRLMGYDVTKEAVKRERYRMAKR